MGDKKPMIPVTALTALAPLLGGLAGGKSGDTNISQSATNTTSLSLSNILSNQSPGAQSAPSSGSASGGASAGSGTEPLQLSPLATPFSGFGSLAAEDNFNAAAGTGQPPKQLIMAGAAILLGVGVLAIFNRKKRR